MKHKTYRKTEKSEDSKPTSGIPRKLNKSNKQLKLFVLCVPVAHANAKASRKPTNEKPRKSPPKKKHKKRKACGKFTNALRRSETGGQQSESGRKVGVAKRRTARQNAA